MWSLRKQRRKYGNVPVEYKGAKYASKKEQQKAWELDCLLKAGEIKSWERQVREELRGINGSKICDYYVDFVVYHNNGLKEYIEIKSPITMTEVWRLKWKLLEDKYKYEISRDEIKLSVET